MNPGRLILVVLATVVIFAAGVVTGGLLIKKLDNPHVLPSGQPFWSRFEVTRRAVDELDRRGELTPEQRLQIEQVIRDNQELIAEYFSILEPDVQQVFRKMREGIRAELTPEQRKRFEEFTRKKLNRANERRTESSRGGTAPGEVPSVAGDKLPPPPERPIRKSE